MKHKIHSDEMQRCIDDCFQCHRTCLQMATTHCLDMGGKHAESPHLRLMLSCAEQCQTAGNAMLMQSPAAETICSACADVCDACATDCERIGDMDDCVQACRRCAASCRAMSTHRASGGKPAAKPAM